MELRLEARDPGGGGASNVLATNPAVCVVDVPQDGGEVDVTVGVNLESTPIR